MNQIQTKPFCASSLNLAHMLTMINPIDFGGHSSKVNVTMGIIDKCGVRGDATLCVVIFFTIRMTNYYVKRVLNNKRVIFTQACHINLSV